MLYLTSGANGAGKTLLTLRDVREKSIAEGRPVAYNGRFKLTAEFGWRQIDVKDWQGEPDGTIFLFDECHNDFPVRPNGSPVPEYVKMLAEHRARGFDFYLITQHPMNIDAFIRRIIGPPGWHRHIKRTTGGSLVSVCTYAAVRVDCEKQGSSASGSVAMVAYPKEVYAWYESTSLDTAKKRIPFQLKVLIACVLALPVIAYFAWQSVLSMSGGIKGRMGGTQAVGGPKGAASAPVQLGQPVVQAGPRVLTPAEYAANFTPRIAGLAHTAPRYDAATQPVAVPYPAACISSGPKCSCWTQQATPLQVPDVMCREIVKGGFFADWQGAIQESRAGRPVVASKPGV